MESTLANRKTAVPFDSPPPTFAEFSAYARVTLETGVETALSKLRGVKVSVLSWKGTSSAPIGVTARVELAPDFALEPGTFSADVELFVLSGGLQVGEQVLTPHTYSYIPATQHLGNWAVLPAERVYDGSPLESGLCGAKDSHNVELLWMENGPSACKFTPGKWDSNVGSHKDFVPAMDTTLIPWGNTQTALFRTGSKKWLRRLPNGGGTWLLCVLPHYDSHYGILEMYNEEAYCVSGSLDVGGTRFVPGVFHYSHKNALSGRHISRDGALVFVRVDEDLSRPDRVAGVNLRSHLPPKSLDWATTDPATLPEPSSWVPDAFLDHMGAWEGTYTHIGKDGHITDVHECKLEIGIRGHTYSQRNTYRWRAEDGSVQKEEVWDFPGAFDRTGFLRIDSEKIVGWAQVIESADEGNGAIVFYGRYKGEGDVPDTFDLIRTFDGGNKRFRTWQVGGGKDLLKIVHVEEKRTSRENYFWLPRPELA